MTNLAQCKDRQYIWEAHLLCMYQQPPWCTGCLIHKTLSTALGCINSTENLRQHWIYAMNLMKAYHQTYTSTGDVTHLYQKWLKIEMFPGVSALLQQRSKLLVTKFQEEFRHSYLYTKSKHTNWAACSNHSYFKSSFFTIFQGLRNTKLVTMSYCTSLSWTVVHH